VASRIRVVIADDESPARRKLLRFLSTEVDFDVCGEAASGLDAIKLIQDQRPDLVFLDIQMPGADGFEVIRALKPEFLPQVVFVTAYDSFALKAFEVHALDYLLKPFDRARFRKVLDRARHQAAHTSSSDLEARLGKLLEELGKSPKFAERIMVRASDRETNVLVSVDKIDWIEGARNYVNIHSGSETYALRSTIDGICDKLDPSKFVRVNRSSVVRVDAIKELQPWFHGEYKVVLKNGTELTWSRRFLDRSPDVFLKLG
jgi:two-component system, LytTR family, response regulator